MSQEFAEQGGAATMDPSPFRRWVTSRVITSMIRPGRQEKAEAVAERARVKAGLPHRVEYFHQVDDPYSHLAAQALQPLQQRYAVELVPHLVRAPTGANLPEPQMLPALARHDAALVAPHYGLDFPASAVAPEESRSASAARMLAGVPPAQFAEAAVAVGAALHGGDGPALERLAERYPAVPEGRAQRVLDEGTDRRAALGHYAGAMFHYGGQWYWGVDRLYHLERRWIGLGLGAGDELLFPRPPIETGSYRDNGSMTLEFYASLRSPYTALIFDKVVELAERAGVRLALRPVLPMVMRGVSLSREKGLYIFRDAAREARALGVDFGKFYDPIGEPTRRCFSLFNWAGEQGKRVALMGAFLRAAFVEGVNTSRDSGMRYVVEQAGLSWREAAEVIGNDDWQAELEANRLAMCGFGAWGVPTFRLLDAEDDPVVWAWGQDRLWLVAREIQRMLVQA